MRSILVTGGAGFVGSHVALGLKARHAAARVIALDNLKRRGSELNLPRLRAGGVEFLFGDIRQPGDIEEVGPIGALIECSAEPSVLAGYGASPRYVVDTNLSGTVNCLEHARKHNAAIIFLSTSRVYPIDPLTRLTLRETETRFELDEGAATPGVSAEGVNESFQLMGARSMYGATKLASELLLAEYLAMYGMRGIVNRCGVIAGPWQMGKVDQGVAVLWMARHVYGGGLRYIGFGGQGKQVRDLLHIEDLLELLHYQLAHLKQLSGKTFNVGGGRNVSASLCEMTALCEEISGRKITLEREPETRPADIPWYISDHREVSAATHWKPRRDVRTIFADIHRWLIDERSALEPILGIIDPR